MALIEETLFGKVDKVKTAMERLKMFEPPEGYYIAYSGGKDSEVVLNLAKVSGVKFDAHHNLTTVDPPELVRHVKTHPEIEIHRPELTMWQLIVKKKIPPLRHMRYCCDVLKERGGSGRVVVTGVRWEESSKRKKRGMVEQCYNDNSKRYLHPIIDWAEEDVWQYIRENKLPYCKLYDEGFKRLGCVCCPLTKKEQRLIEAKRWPKIAEAYKRACIKSFEKFKEEGLKEGITWQSGEDMFNWWMDGSTVKKEDENQETFFLE